MKVSDYIASFLSSHGVTDAFGIPGGVILDFLYALDAADGITPHLSYHEQTAGFAACGYAQASGRLGVAYATRGPGFTNLLSSMADAYYDSIPVLFVTGHTTAELPSESRVIEDQEMDTCAIVRNITKYAKRLDSLDDVQNSLEDAYRIAMDGRKGPVFLDIKTSLFKQEIYCVDCKTVSNKANKVEASILIEVVESIKSAKRPVLLIGDGINQCHLWKELNQFVYKCGIPVISSRYSHNVINNSSRYYGYVGSHGIRYANFILSKADLVITLGNRLCFPSSSASFSPVVDNSKIIRFDVDKGELLKHSDIANRYLVNLNDLLPAIAEMDANYGQHNDWLHVCDQLRTELWTEDCCEVVNQIASILSGVAEDTTLISDVGNNEFWVSRAAVLAQCNNHTLYSKSFGTLGNALGKAIGAYYANGKPVVAFIGDQGLQLNIQELQYISQHNLPILIVLLDNSSSGMIKDREIATQHDYYLHTTMDSGYGSPNFEQIASAYKLKCVDFTDKLPYPSIVHIRIDDGVALTPSLPKGKPLQDMNPELDRERYNKLNLM